MDSAFVSYRFVGDDYGFFEIKIYPSNITEPILEYKNGFSEVLESIKGTEKIQKLYVGLKKLEKYAEDKTQFYFHLKELLLQEKKVIDDLLKNIHFETEEHYQIINVLNALENAKEAGFLDGLQAITEVKNKDAWSSWKIQGSKTNDYCLSGIVEKAEYVDFTFANKNTGVVQSWDNPSFLYQNFYPILQKAYFYKNQIIEATNKEIQLPQEFWDNLPDSKKQVTENILQNIPIQDWAYVYEMILEAQKIGFWQLYLNRNVAQTLENLTEIHKFYQKQTPEYFKSNQIKPATDQQIIEIENSLGEKLEPAYQAFLKQNTLSFDFDGNFKVLSILEVIKRWQGMNELLDEGVFDDGRVEYHLEHDFGNWNEEYIQQVWWSKKWLPFAEDSCGNMKCIDFSPAENGNMYQLVSMEIQDGQGPFVFNEYQDFTDFLATHLKYLQRKQYRLVEYNVGNMIEVDSYIKPIS
jgi:cell wall assembly regulator SMI1